MRGGFGGGLVVDYPHSTKAKKYFLVLLAGPPDPEFAMPSALGEDGQSVAGGSSAMRAASSFSVASTFMATPYRRCMVSEAVVSVAVVSAAVVSVQP